MQKITYEVLQLRSLYYYGMVSILCVLLLSAWGALQSMMEQGHVVTGMNNHVVWGILHVLAIGLIVMASGVLHITSLATLFKQDAYQPFTRLAAVLALAFLLSGLLLLAVDLGRPERVWLMLRYYNLHSVFSWNVVLYSGFIGLVSFYLWSNMAKRGRRYTLYVGGIVFFWRLALTTGSGSIFALLLARDAYGSMGFIITFIALSFMMGLAVFIVVLMVIAHGVKKDMMSRALLLSMRRLLAVFLIGLLLFESMRHIIALLDAQSSAFSLFLLSGDSSYSKGYWLLYVVLGTVCPLILCLTALWGRSGLLLASVLALLGGMSWLYIIVVAGQAFPQPVLLDAWLESTYYDGQLAYYTPSLTEWAIVVGGIAFAVSILFFSIVHSKILPTQSVSDKLPLYQ